MAIPANAHPWIKQFGTDIDATASWTGTNYYPSVDFSSATFPACLPDLSEYTSDVIDDSSVGLKSGTIEARFYYATTGFTVQEAEDAVRAIVSDLHGLSTGLPYRSFTVSPGGRPEEAEKAGGAGIYAVDMIAEIGVENGG